MRLPDTVELAKKLLVSAEADAAKIRILEAQRPRIKRPKRPLEPKISTTQNVSTEDITHLLRNPSSNIFSHETFEPQIKERIEKFVRAGAVKMLKDGRMKINLLRGEQAIIKQVCFSICLLDLSWSFLKTELVLGKNEADQVMEMVATETKEHFPGLNSHKGPLLIARGRKWSQLLVVSDKSETEAKYACAEIDQKIRSLSTHKDLPPTKISFACTDSVRAARLIPQFYKNFQSEIGHRKTSSNQKEINHIMMADLIARSRAAIAANQIEFLFNLKIEERNLFYRTLPEVEATFYKKTVAFYKEYDNNPKSKKGIFAWLLQNILPFWIQNKHEQHKKIPSDIDLIFERFGLKVLQYEQFNKKDN